jgi:hypothetical protein
MYRDMQYCASGQMLILVLVPQDGCPLVGWLVVFLVPYSLMRMKPPVFEMRSPALEDHEGRATRGGPGHVVAWR